MSKAASVFIATLSPEVEQLEGALADEGIPSRVLRCADEALVLLEQARNPLLVLDCELPLEDVKRLYERAHTFPAVPLLILFGAEGPPFKSRSSRGRLEERVAQPAQPLELALRVKALMLRAGYTVPSRKLEVVAAGPAPSPAAQTAPDVNRSPSTWRWDWPRCSVARPYWSMPTSASATSASCST